MRTTKTQGFTLIEMMIVVAIMGIIAAIAIPSYFNYVTRSGRTEATTELVTIAAELQECYTTYSAFNDSSCPVYAKLTGGSGIVTRDGNYTITISNTAATTYTLTATPVAGTTQAQDTGCTKFTLEHTGARSATGSEAGDCW